MKKYILSALALALILTACGAPSAEVTPAPTPTEQVTPSPDIPPEADDTRYFFAQTYFLGAWSDGQWRSCETDAFTVGEILNRDYYDIWGETLGTIRLPMDGPGGFDEMEGAAGLLEPFGIMEGYEFIMKLPGQLTGEAARVTAPNYNFCAYFEGQPHYFVSNVPTELPDYRKTWDSFLLLEVASAVLEEAGIYCDPFNMSHTVWACDMDGDGQEEYLELIQTLFDESGYAILEPGDQCCYALLLRDEEQVSLVASRAIDYTTDVTAHFSAGDVQFCDLDGDGLCEIIFREQCWEWGCYEAYSWIDGAWTQVLRSNYGM